VRNNQHEGQAGLLLLVVIGVVVGLIMSIASRSISDSAMSRKGKESNAAFSVAENGIEEALQALANGGTPPTGPQTISDSTGNISGTYEVTETSSFELYVKEGESAQIDFGGVAGNVAVRWVLPSEDPGTCSEGSGNAPAALEITLFSTTNVATRSYYNAYGCNQTSTNGFLNAGIGTAGFGSLKTVGIGTQDRFMRLKPIYNGATIRVSTAIPNLLDSTLYLLQSAVTGGDAQKEIEVKRSFDTAGSVFDYALFSGGTITK